MSIPKSFASLSAQQIAGLLLSASAIIGPTLGLALAITQPIAQAAKPAPKPKPKPKATPKATTFFRYIMPDGSVKTGYKGPDGVHKDCDGNKIIGWEKVFTTERTCN